MSRGAEAPPLPPPTPGVLATLGAALAATMMAVLALGVGPDWMAGPVGGGDAWQSLWNLDHVRRVLDGETGLWFSHQVWAPEGASLRAHTLAPTLSVPGALLARALAPHVAYNVLVLLTFALAGATTFRLARRLGLSPGAALLAGLALAFAPARTARAFGHLNLCALGLVPLALEGLVVAARRTGARAWAGAAVAAAALLALGLTDWYLALLGALAATTFAAFELARGGGRRAAITLRLGLTGVIALAALAPVARPLAAEPGIRGHDPRHCSTALTSLVVPNRVQRVAAWTEGLTGRNSQNLAEGAAYLGLVPLAALAWLLARPTQRPRDLDWALAAGAAGLVLALGPAPRIFDRWLEIPLPYRWLEAAVPALATGGCASRLVQLAALPLALATGWAADRLHAGGGRGRAVLAAAVAVLAVEYAPVTPPVMRWPVDPAMSGLAAAPGDGVVLDLDSDVTGLVRQLGHGRPQTLGYLSRRPEAQWERRRLDPVIGPLLGHGEVAAAPPLATAAAWLRHRWGVRWVVATPGSEALIRAEELGLAARNASDRSVVSAVPELPLDPLAAVDLAEETAPLARRGVVLEGVYGPETVGVAGGALRGRWTGPRALVLAPLGAGSWRLRLAAPRPDPPTVRLKVGGRTVETTVRGVDDLLFTVGTADLGADGGLLLTLEASPYRPPADRRELGVFLVTLDAHVDDRTRVESSRR